MTAFDRKFIENQVFLKWVFNTNPDIDHYWEQYLLNHPEEKKQLFELKHNLSGLKFSNDGLHNFEKKDLANQIIKNLTLKLNPKKNRFNLFWVNSPSACGGFSPFGLILRPLAAE